MLRTSALAATAAGATAEETGLKATADVAKVAVRSTAEVGTAAPGKTATRSTGATAAMVGLVWMTGGQSMMTVEQVARMVQARIQEWALVV